MPRILFRNLLMISVALPVACATVSGTAFAADITVAVFAGRMGGALKKQIVTPFREKSKSDVAEDDRDWGIGVVRTRVDAGGNTWDVVTAEDIEVLQGCEEGTFAPLDKSKLSKLSKYEVEVADGSCGLPMAIYTMTLSYNTAKTTKKPETWAHFWDAETWPGMRSMYRTPRDSMEIALMADGVAKDDVYKVLGTSEGVDRAFKKLDELKNNIVWYTNAGQARQMLASGETIMSATYTAGLLSMNKYEQTTFGVSSDGSIRHTDYWAVVNNRSNDDNIYKFLNYATEPKPQADFANATLNSVPNSDAATYMADDVRPVLVAGPESTKSSLISNSEFWLNNFDALNQRFENWLAQ